MTFKPPEIWAYVKGREDYMVSNTGKVKSYHRRWRRWVDKKPREDSKGYLTVGISPPNSKETNSARVHRLVASSFIPNPSNLPYVNHKDNNPKNNDASNLEWCDAKYNMEYSFFSGDRGSGHSKPVKLYVNGELFSYYTSVEKCSLSISKNKKFFNLAKEVFSRFDGMFRIEILKDKSIPNGVEVDKPVLLKRLENVNSIPVMYKDVPFPSIVELSKNLGIKYGRVRHAYESGRQLDGSEVTGISYKEYISKSGILNE